MAFADEQRTAHVVQHMNGMVMILHRSFLLISCSLLFSDTWRILLPRSRNQSMREDNLIETFFIITGQIPQIILKDELILFLSAQCKQ